MYDPLALRVRLHALSADAPCVPLHFFHVRGEERRKLGVDGALFAARGDIVFASPYEAQLFARAFNEAHGRSEDTSLRAADVNAMGLIHEVLHAVFALYRQRFGRGPFDALEGRLRAELGDDLTAT